MPAKILCVRLSAMGDLVVTTPVIRALRQQLGAEVHLVTKPAFAPVVEGNPYLARLHLWGEGVVRRLRAERFDLVVDLHGSIRSHLLRLRLGVPAVGFRKRNLEKYLLARGIDLLGRQHLVDRYFAGLRGLGVRDDGRGLDYVVSAGERERAGELIADLAPGGRYVCLVLGATHFTKRMPASVAASVVAGIGTPVVLLGGPDVRALAEEVVAAVGARAALLDLCGRTALRESIAVLDGAAGVVAGDTGLMHVTAALGRPMVVVWGNTAPAIGMYPRYPAGEGRRYADAEVGGLDCRPCSRIGFAACPRGHFRCMREQRGDAIARALHELMAAPRPEPTSATA